MPDSQSLLKVCGGCWVRRLLRRCTSLLDTIADLGAVSQQQLVVSSCFLAVHLAKPLGVPCAHAFVCLAMQSYSSCKRWAYVFCPQVQYGFDATAATASRPCRAGSQLLAAISRATTADCAGIRVLQGPARSTSAAATEIIQELQALLTATPCAPAAMHAANTNHTPAAAAPPCADRAGSDSGAQWPSSCNNGSSSGSGGSSGGSFSTAFSRLHRGLLDLEGAEQADELLMQLQRVVRLDREASRSLIYGEWLAFSSGLTACCSA